jgi:hypothetical protein
MVSRTKAVSLVKRLGEESEVMVAQSGCFQRTLSKGQKVIII